MRNRPWPLIVLALIQIVTPFINIFFNAWILEVSPLRVLHWVLERPAFDAFQTLALMPIAGLAIWTMKPWSYPLFIIAILWSAIRHLANWQMTRGVMPLPMAVLTYLFELVLVGYFMLPKVRTTYFDPTVRWWESKPRYVLELKALLAVAGRKIEAQILNLSEGGLFITSSGDLSVDQEYEIQFDIVNLPYKVLGKVIHNRKMDDGRSCFGVQLIHTPETADQFRALTRALQELGFQNRGVGDDWRQSLKKWALTLVTTGRGLLPEPQYRKAASKARKSS